MKAKQIIRTGKKYLGTPYVFNSPPFQSATFDCSSFIQYIFHENGIALPRNSRQQFLAGKDISGRKIKKGDLLFFTTTKRKNLIGISKIGHVALYIGDGKMLHTSKQGGKVKVSKLKKYWKTAYVGARRVI